MPPKSTLSAQQKARLQAAEDLKLRLAQQQYKGEDRKPLLPSSTEERTPLLSQKDLSAEVRLPTEGYSPIDIEEEPRVTASTETVPTATTLLNQGIEEETGLAPLVRQAARVGTFSQEQQDYLFGKNPEELSTIEKGIREDLASQNVRASRSTPTLYESQVPSQFIETLSANLPENESLALNEDSVSTVLKQGELFNNSLNATIRPSLAATTEEAFKLQNFIANPENNLWDSETQRLSDRVGTALAVVFGQIGQDLSNKNDDSIKLTGENLTSDAVNPEQIRERISEKLFNELFPNPNVGFEEDIRTGYGGASKFIDPEVKQMFDVISYKAIADSKMFDVIDLNANDDTTSIKEEIVRLSDAGNNYVNSVRDVIEAIHPDQRVNVSYSPAPVEGLPGRERELGDKAKPISKRNRSSKNTAFEDSVKLKMSTIPLRIDKDGFSYAAMIVNSTLRRGPDNRIELVEPNPSRYFWSEGQFAKLLGISESDWLETKAKALKKYGKEQEYKANDQADRVMRMKARKAFQTIQDGIDNIDKVFYNKYMHASSVGRLFVRNMVLNGQSDKALARGMVVSAKKLLINVNKIKNKDKTFENWKYIIGKNLLDPDQSNNYNLTNGLRTEDMTWQAITRITNEIINNKNDPTYRQWYNRGKALKAALAENNIQKLSQAIDGIHSKEFKKSGEWGFKLQSYIDFANYVDAKNGNGMLEMRATTQHDGKQNGIAIQAMQTGDFSALELVGMVYNPDEDNVIPQGDIRDKFINVIINDTKIAFNSKLDRQAFWTDLLKEIKDSPIEKRSDYIKALSKTPLMESSYGMPIEFHMETAMDFIDNSGNDLMQKVIERHSMTEDNYSRQEMIMDLNNLIGIGLKNTLNLKQQRLYKDAGMLWAMLGVTPNMTGPLGTDIYMGTNEHFKTGRTIEVANKDGTTTLIELTQRKSTGSAAKRARNTIYDFEKKEYRTSDRSRFGKLVSNQLPVLTVQQIDAAIMMRTLDAVNRNFKKEGKGFEPVKFVLPVHDALITNAEAVDVYHREINNQFKKVNMEYSISQSIYQGLNRAFEKMRKRVEANPNKMVDINYESRFRAVHDYLVLIEDKLNRGKATYKEATGFEVESDYDVKLSSKERELLIKAKQAGWNREGAKIRLSVLFDIINDYQKGKTIITRLKQNHMLNESSKPKLFRNLLAEKPYAYN